MEPVNFSEAFRLSRRCFLAAAGLSVATSVPAGETVPQAADLPKVHLLRNGEEKAYLLAFHTGQEVMKGLLAFARKHKLVAG
jgi:hypothetical protein